jgi:hypothetical protein
VSSLGPEVLRALWNNLAFWRRSEWVVAFLVAALAILTALEWRLTGAILATGLGAFILLAR